MSGRGFAGAVEQLLGFGSLYHHSGLAFVHFYAKGWVQTVGGSMPTVERSNIILLCKTKYIARFHDCPTMESSSTFTFLSSSTKK